MSRQSDLEQNIREAYTALRGWEKTLPYANPTETLHAQHEIERLKDVIAAAVRERAGLPGPLPADVVELAASVGVVATRPRGLIPAPPEPYFAHPYPLQEHFTGRARERQMLTAWLAHDPGHPILALVAMGGMGKSALTWAWALRDLLGLPLPGAPADDCDPACQVPQAARPAGLLWWSFYEQGADVSALLEKALVYLSAGEIDPAALPSRHERVEALLALLQSRPVLLVLDGFERALRAYSGLGAAYQGDADAPPEREDPRACADAHAGDLLRRAAGLPLRGRLLLTTRLLPRELAGAAGARAEQLEALEPADAAAFFRRLGVRGTAAEVQEACAPYGNHPLALRLLAGLVLDDPARPGDIAAAADYRVADALVPREHHILQMAYDALRPAERELLSRMAAFRGPVAYAALAALAGAGEEDGLKAGLRALALRGLILQDRAAARYDLHPVVRRYAYDRLGDKEGVHRRLHDHFFSAQFGIARAPRPEELAPVIELYHHTARAGRYDEAFDLYRDRLNEPLYYQLGAYAVVIELLGALLPDGADGPPRLEDEAAQAWMLNALAHAYVISGRPRRAAGLRERAAALLEKGGRRGDLAVALGNLAMDQLFLGRLAAAAANLRRRIALCREIGDEWREAVGRQNLGEALACAGAYAEAERELAAAEAVFHKRSHPQGEGVVWARRARAALLCGAAAEAAEAAGRAWALAEETARRGYPYERDFVRALWLRGAAALTGGEDRAAEAEALLDTALLRCRRIDLVEQEPAILLDLARWHRARGQAEAAGTRAGEALELAERCEYRLHQADAHNVLARLALDAGDRAAAREHAGLARERAWCDGPPSAYQAALEEAERILAAVGG